MYTVYYDANGALLAAYDDTFIAPGADVAPQGSAGHVNFDPVDNPGLPDQLFGDWNAFSVVNGALEHGGSPVPIVPSTLPQRERNAATALLSDLGPEAKLLRAVLLTLVDAVNGVRALPQLGLPPLSAAQVRQAVLSKLNSGNADK